MEFEGVVLQVLPVFKTNTQRGEFVKQEVVFEQPGEFSRKVCVAFTGDRVPQAQALNPGEKVKISFNIESREWNGRWFTEIRGWKLERLDAQGAAPQYGAPQPPQYGAPQPPQYGTPQPSAGAYPVYSTPAAESTSEGPTSNPVEDIPF